MRLQARTVVGFRPGMSLASEPDRSRAPASLADVTASGTATAFLSLAAGPSGKILVTAHPSNSTAIARVSGSDTATSKGTPFAAGASYAFDVANANMLKHIAESGSPVLCVTAV